MAKASAEFRLTLGVYATAVIALLATGLDDSWLRVVALAGVALWFWGFRELGSAPLLSGRLGWFEKHLFIYGFLFLAFLAVTGVDRVWLELMAAWGGALLLHGCLVFARPGSPMRRGRKGS